jgi:hypothetical protein
MAFRSHIGRFIAVGLLPAFLLTGALPGLDLFQCRHDGEVRFSSCCADGEMEDEKAAPAADLAFDELACCEVTHVEFARAPIPPSVTHVDVALPPLELAWTLEAPALSLQTFEAALRGPDTTGPPIRLQTQTFLN